MVSEFLLHATKAMTISKSNGNKILVFMIIYFVFESETATAINAIILPIFKSYKLNPRMRLAVVGNRKIWL